MNRPGIISAIEFGHSLPAQGMLGFELATAWLVLISDQENASNA